MVIEFRFLEASERQLGHFSFIEWEPLSPELGDTDNAVLEDFTWQQCSEWIKWGAGEVEEKRELLLTLCIILSLLNLFQVSRRIFGNSLSSSPIHSACSNLPSVPTSQSLTTQISLQYLTSLTFYHVKTALTIFLF